KGIETGRPHAPCFRQLFDAGDVDRAPHAAAAPWREPDLVALLVNPLADAVDPADHKRFVHRFGPGDARFPRVLLVEPDPEEILAGVMLRKPAPQLRRGLEEPHIGCGRPVRRSRHRAGSAAFGGRGSGSPGTRLPSSKSDGRSPLRKPSKP